MNKRWKRILLFLGLPIVIGGLIYWFAWAGTTKPIESVADRFKAPSSWKLLRSDATAPGLCVAETCPRLNRAWETLEIQTKEQLVELVKKAGWTQVKPDEDCDSIVCQLEGFVDGYTVRLSSSTPNPGDPPEVNLFIQ